jgi:DNA-binding IclR family transcriptional regulator
MTSDLPVPAAVRTVRLLELLLTKPQGITPQECMEHLDITRSSLFTLLQTLKQLGYIEQMKVRGRYRPGPRLLAWRRVEKYGPQDLLGAFRQETASSPMDETLAVIIPSPPQLLLLSQKESTQRLRTGYEIGQRIPPDESAAGPVLEASPSEAIRTSGYHLQEGPEILELALPICKDGHRPNAALLLSAPLSRHTPGSLLSHLPTLREMAARLSYRLGAPVYAPYSGPSPIKIEPTVPLSKEETTAFLKGPWVATLACIRPDGTPHVVPVWHEYDGDAFYVAAWGGSRWADFLIADPRVSLTVDEPWPPLRRVSAQGIAQPLANDDLAGGIHAVLNRLSLRFLGEPLNLDFDDHPWHAFRIHPKQLRGWRGLRSA